MNQANIAEPVFESGSTVEIAKQALAEAKELIELEIQLAKVEARDELKKMKAAAIAGALAFTLLLLGLGLLPLYALAVGGGLVLLAGAAAAYAYSAIPKAPLDHTRERLKEDIQRLREHTA